MLITKAFLDEVSYNIIGSAIEVQKALGPGLLESVYHRCLAYEFEVRGIPYVSEMCLPIMYKGIQIESDLRADFYIANCIVVELKAVDKLISIHDAQILTYMKMLSSPKGILINFNSENIFKTGQKTLVNQFYAALQ